MLTNAFNAHSDYTSSLDKKKIGTHLFKIGESIHLFMVFVCAELKAVYQKLYMHLHL